MTPTQIDALPDYTVTQKIKFFEYAQIMGWGGTTRTIDGRSVTFPPALQLQQLIDHLKSEEAGEDEDNNGGVSLVVFGRPR